MSIYVHIDEAFLVFQTNVNICLFVWVSDNCSTDKRMWFVFKVECKCAIFISKLYLAMSIYQNCFSMKSVCLCLLSPSHPGSTRSWGKVLQTTSEGFWRRTPDCPNPQPLIPPHLHSGAKPTEGLPPHSVASITDTMSWFYESKVFVLITKYKKILVHTLIWHFSFQEGFHKESDTQNYFQHNFHLFVKSFPCGCETISKCLRPGFAYIYIYIN